MAAHDRSFTTARAARLILLVGVLVALAWVLHGMLDRRLGGGGDGPRAAAPAAPANSSAPRRIAARDEVLEARVRSIRARTIDRGTRAAPRVAGRAGGAAA